MEVINDELFEFLNKHRDADPASLLFSMHGKELTFSLPFAITQLEARRKTRTKIPSFLANDRFIFPDSLAAEQASDERVSKFHSSLVGTGNRILDITAGLGIDSMTMAMNGNELTVCEINPQKAMMLEHNSKVMALPYFDVFTGSCEKFLSRNPNKFDIVFADPARRDSDNRRTYSLEDCVPDILTLLPGILEMSPKVLIKVSPVLDISKMINDVPYLEIIYAVCVKGECKELLLQIKRDSAFKGYRVVDLDNDGIISDIGFSAEELYDEDIRLADDSLFNDNNLVGKYLYEPNAGVMKLPKKSVLANKFDGLRQVGHNTPLFVSECLYPEFPGRVLKIENILSKSEYSRLKGERYNVVSRNYPISADDLRKKLKVKEGKDKFIYAFRTGKGNKPILSTAVRT